MIPSESPSLQEEGDGAQRLTTYEHCQIYAATKWRSAKQVYKASASKLKGKPMPQRRWQNRTIARVFGVSEFTVSQIKTCLTAYKPRYQNLVTEWRALGEAEFMRVYYTPELREKLILAARS